MAESDEHRHLVQQLFNHTVNNWMVDVGDAIFLDAVNRKKPPRIGDYIPDLYARHPTTNQLIIGEAETGRSINQIHAEKQIATFLDKCAQETPSIFILAVPWYMRPYAKKLLRNMQNQTGFAVYAVVIDELGS